VIRPAVLFVALMLFGCAPVYDDAALAAAAACKGWGPAWAACKRLGTQESGPAPAPDDPTAWPDCGPESTPNATSLDATCSGYTGDSACVVCLSGACCAEAIACSDSTCTSAASAALDTCTSSRCLEQCPGAQ
jgi:hypothetical protein